MTFVVVMGIPDSKKKGAAGWVRFAQRLCSLTLRGEGWLSAYRYPLGSYECCLRQRCREAAYMLIDPKGRYHNP